MANEETPFPKLDDRLMSEQVADHIRGAVKAGKLLPGHRLPPENELAEQFGVSRITVRDALKRLQGAGLISMRVGGAGGPYVALPDLDQLSEAIGSQLHLRGASFAEIAEVRMALEVTAAQLAAERATKHDLDELKKQLSLPVEPPSCGDDTRGLFHTALVRAANNDALFAVFAAVRAVLKGQFSRDGVDYPLMHDSRRTHEEIFHAVSERDAERAARLMQDHLSEFATEARRATDT